VSSRSFPLRAFLLTAAAPVIWSTGGIGVRILEVPPTTVLFWRSLFTTFTLLLWSVLSFRKDTKAVYADNLRRGWPVALFLAMSFISYIYSVTNTSVADSLLIQGTAPIFIVLLGWIILRDRPGVMTLVALVMVIAGISIIMVYSGPGRGLLGNIFGLIKALSFASAAVAIRGIRKINHLPATALAALITAFFALMTGADLRVGLGELAVLAYLGIFQVGLGFILFVTWSGSLRASQTGLLVILEAVLGPLWPWIFLGERPSPATFVGGAVIIGALVLHSLYFERRSPRLA